MEHDSESGSIQHNSALDMLKQRQRMSAGPPTLIDQQPHVLYTMSPQTVERLEDVLRKTLRSKRLSGQTWSRWPPRKAWSHWLLHSSCQNG